MNNNKKVREFIEQQSKRIYSKLKQKTQRKAGYESNYYNSVKEISTDVSKKNPSKLKKLKSDRVIHISNVRENSNTYDNNSHSYSSSKKYQKHLYN